MVWVSGIIVILIGLAMLFWGYRLFRVWLAVAGFLLGAALGYWIGLQLLPGEVWPIVLAAGVGIVLALLAWFLYMVGVVLTGAFLGALLSALIFGLFGVAPSWWVWLIGAIPGGIIAGVLSRPYLIIASSFQGACMVVFGVYSMTVHYEFYKMQPGLPVPLLDLPWYIYVGILVLTIVGAIVQFRTNKGRQLPKQSGNKPAAG